MPSGADEHTHRTFFLAPPWPAPGGRITLDAEESRHALRSMRVRTGDTVRIVDGRGCAAEAIALPNDRGSLPVSIGEPEPVVADQYPAGRVVLPWIKTVSRMDWVIEKATELGAVAFDIFVADLSVRSRPREKSGKCDRWQRIAKAAMKQSGRAWLPDIQIYDSLEAVLKERVDAPVFVADPGGLVPSAVDFPSDVTSDTLLLVGAEGGWSEREKALIDKQETRAISLGPGRLRVETAAVILCALMSLGVRRI